ncbi:hypothetical protein SERLA73DRAFT_70238 [Serpula lacrymans var. lacrymans S7.3]|uniref:Uncharacterized protein n=2 Tax=Serpula lacrymans var. lacrymans TaxID=341189 RepID=F8PMC5_SERL3|nr:uncharacterized protein SERLADRAFT_434367 [Serpula lacrymans var. lacrymans S7.9]EGO02757.1 hypothetical protein SERLA73DRAFT_70238 [Serpula lacrymans var. lacrymans S7.3]EGO28457.1 hypothetical protein SERLADRAFT_434367 [Serpula lacrymans var. lacrymans S7.9]
MKLLNTPNHASAFKTHLELCIRMNTEFLLKSSSKDAQVDNQVEGNNIASTGTQSTDVDLDIQADQADQGVKDNILNNLPPYGTENAHILQIGVDSPSYGAAIDDESDNVDTENAHILQSGVDSPSHGAAIDDESDDADSIQDNDQSAGEQGTLTFPDLEYDILDDSPSHNAAVDDESDDTDSNQDDPASYGADADLDDENPHILHINSTVAYPPVQRDLQAKLLDGCKCPVVPPSSVSEPSSLTDLEIHSLKHYIAWKKSNGTVKAYELHAQVLQQATQLDILSLYAVRKLAGSLAKVEPVKIDMCPRSCIAYDKTG